MESSRIRLARFLQIWKSVPHYLWELSRLRSVPELASWFQFKLPYLVPVPGFPSKLTIELTNRCNFRCPYCHRSVMKRGEGDMDFALFCKLLDEVRVEDLCTVKMGGLGEPSLYERFGDAMVALRDRGIHHATYTNGTLFRRFSHAEILSWQIPHLVVSIDGVDASSFNRQRLGGDYAELERNLIEFYAARDQAGATRPLIEVRHVILPKESSQEIARFRQHWLKVADTVMFNHVIPGTINATGPGRRCRDIRREMYVRWTGRIPLCGYQYLQTDYEWIGDLRTGTIRDAWRHQRLNEVRRLHRAGGMSIPDFCRNCSQTV